jgi:glucokinase
VILAGDIGGTNARLAFFTVEDGRLKALAEHTYPTHQYASLEPVVEEFVTDNRLKPAHACFGIAGPVAQGRAAMPNLKWIVESTSLAKLLAIDRVTLINDLEANAYGIAALAPDDFEQLNAGAPDVRGNAAVIAAGTGLGEAGLYWDGRRHHPFACEGGHADFAPADDLQCELAQCLRKEFGHVSCERVLSGPGIFSIYRFLRDTGRGAEPAWLTRELAEGDPAAGISRAAMEGRSELCAQTLDLFVAIYASEAGNLALKLMATGGVYLGGGIAPRIIAKLKAPAFMREFTSKGRMQPLLEGIPVKVILNDKTALLGAARCAALQAALL